MPDSVYDGADLDVLTSLVTLPLAGGAQCEGDRAVGGPPDADDFGAQVAPGEHRVDEFEIAVDGVRGKGGLDDRPHEGGESGAHRMCLLWGLIAVTEIQ